MCLVVSACGPSEHRETEQRIVDSFESWEATVHPSSCSWRYGLPRCPYAGRYEDEITNHCNEVASTSKGGLDALLQAGWRIQSHEDWTSAGDETVSDGTTLRITCKGQRYIIVRTCVTRINLFGSETPDPRCVAAVEAKPDEPNKAEPDDALMRNASDEARDEATTEDSQPVQEPASPAPQQSPPAVQRLQRQPITPAQGRALADAVSEQIKPCYKIPDNLSDSAWDIKTTFRLLLDRNGRLSSPPMMMMQSGVRPEYESEAQLMEKAAERAITQCSPLRLPAELYDGGWEDMEIMFNPRTFQ